MTARERRGVVRGVQAAYGISERRAIRFTGFPRATIRYRTVRPLKEEMELRSRLRKLAEEHTRWGYRILHTLLLREGWRVNRKRVQRLYREEGLAVRRRRRKSRVVRPRVQRPHLSGPAERWSLDFVSDTLSCGRTFRCLTILDEFSRECIALYPAFSIPAVRVIEVLEQIRAVRGLPDTFVLDNGSEFRSRAFDAWAYARGVTLEFIQPGKPVQNCFIESFNGTLRDDCLNRHWFLTLADARRTLAAWRDIYNTVRPHSSLGGLTPTEFRLKHEHPGTPPTLQQSCRVPK